MGNHLCIRMIAHSEVSPTQCPFWTRIVLLSSWVTKKTGYSAICPRMQAMHPARLSTECYVAMYGLGCRDSFYRSIRAHDLPHFEQYVSMN